MSSEESKFINNTLYIDEAVYNSEQASALFTALAVGTIAGLIARYSVFPIPRCILKSESTDKLYIGQTANLEERIQRHNNNKVGKSRYTHKQKGPWKLIYSEQYNTRSDAMRRERFLKSGQGREWIHDNIIS